MWRWRDHGGRRFKSGRQPYIFIYLLIYFQNLDLVPPRVAPQWSQSNWGWLPGWLLKEATPGGSGGGSPNRYFCFFQYACDHHIEQHSHEFGVSQLRGVGGLVAMQIVMGNQVVWLLPRPSRVVAPLGLDYQLCHFGRRCVTKSEINDRRS